jgi:hypothetical protein
MDESKVRSRETSERRHFGASEMDLVAREPRLLVDPEASEGKARDLDRRGPLQAVLGGEVPARGDPGGQAHRLPVDLHGHYCLDLHRRRNLLGWAA